MRLGLSQRDRVPCRGSRAVPGASPMPTGPVLAIFPRRGLALVVGGGWQPASVPRLGLADGGRVLTTGDRRSRSQVAPWQVRQSRGPGTKDGAVTIVELPPPTALITRHLRTQTPCMPLTGGGAEGGVLLCSRWPGWRAHRGRSRAGVWATPRGVRTSSRCSRVRDSVCGGRSMAGDLEAEARAC